MLARSARLLRSNPYTILGISEGSDVTPASLKITFRKQAARLHPDAGGDEENFKELRSAYDLLLCRHGGASGSGGAVEAETSGGRGFYDSPHAYWANHSSNERRKHHHNDHEGHTRKHGEGLGVEFSAGADWDATQGRWRNFSTRHFYRPYQSDFSHPFGHGFTPEEIEAAKKENKRALVHAVLKYAFLFGCLGFIFALYRRQDRVNRAVQARKKGYRDPDYWAALDGERARQPVLRLQEQWWEKPLELLWGGPEKDDGDGEAERDAAKTLSGSRSSSKASQHGSIGNLSRPGITPTHAVSFHNRPFTPNGVRSPNAKYPKGRETFVNDTSYDPDDVDPPHEPDSTVVRSPPAPRA